MVIKTGEVVVAR